MANVNAFNKDAYNNETPFENIYTSSEAKEILKNKYVLLIGDSGGCSVLKKQNLMMKIK